MSIPTIARDKTAIRRNQLSRPVSLALRDGVLSIGDGFFDYGCGRGEDIEFLSGMGFTADGWDPTHRQAIRPRKADVVNLGYVLNVIEDVAERQATLSKAYELATGTLIVSALIGYGSSLPSKATPYSDGHVTTRGTFQKYFQQDELADYLRTTTGAHPYAAGIGTFYLFRDETREAAYCRALLDEPDARSGAQRPDRGNYQLHPDVLRTIATAVNALGRLPLPDELPEASSAIGILAYSDDWIGRLSGFLTAEELTTVRQARREETMLRLVSSYFSDSGKLRLADMTGTMRADIRSMFGSVSRAYRETEELIGRVFQVSTVNRHAQGWRRGKVTPDGLYLHNSLEAALPFELALIVQAARGMAGSVLPSTANLVKIGLQRLAVSFGQYSRFDEDAHPTLGRSVRADFESGQVAVRDYSGGVSPPILHRKDLLVGTDYHAFKKFRRLSIAEERLGLLGRRDIGTWDAWSRLLQHRGVAIKGHTLRSSASADPEQELAGVTESAELFEHALGDIDSAEHVYKVVRPAATSGRPRERWNPADLSMLSAVLLDLGRPPLEDEVALSSALVRRFQGTRDWQALLGDSFDSGRFEETRRRRWQDWIVRLGTARFSGRESFRRMSLADQADVRYLFGSYRQACSEAEQWLFRIGKPEEIEEAIRSWPQGRHHEEKGLYLHRSLEGRLPVLLRLLINCGRYLCSDALPPSVDVYRVALDGRNVKFYAYESFDEARPSRLVQSAKVDFRRRRVIARRYDDEKWVRTLDLKHDLVDGQYPALPGFLSLLARTEATEAEPQ